MSIVPFPLYAYREVGIKSLCNANEQPDLTHVCTHSMFY